MVLAKSTIAAQAGTAGKRRDPDRRCATAWILASTLAAFLITQMMLWTPAWAQAQGVGKSGLPLPRYVSLKSSKVNVRIGPGRDYDVVWVFTRAGLPVEIIQEFDNWRKIRDSDGAEGWVFHSLLSGRRTAIVAPWSNSGTHAVRSGPSGGDDVVAYLETGVVSEIDECDGDWCQINGDRYRGWIEQDKVWGAYPGELFEGG